MELQRRSWQPFVVAGALCVACGCRDKTTPIVPDSPYIPEVPRTFAVPPIRGTVRETNGGPIAGTHVLMEGRWPLKTAEVIAGEDGVFQFPSWPDGCDKGPIKIRAYRANWYLFQTVDAPPCAIQPSPEVAVEVKAQRSLQVAVDQPLTVVLSNDDLDWPDWNTDSTCAPCKWVEIALPTDRRTTLRVRWSEPQDLVAWLEADADYDLVSLGKQTSDSQNQILARLYPEWHTYYGVHVKIGPEQFRTRTTSLVQPVTLTIEVLPD